MLQMEKRKHKMREFEREKFTQKHEAARGTKTILTQIRTCMSFLHCVKNV